MSVFTLSPNKIFPDFTLSDVCVTVLSTFSTVAWKYPAVPSSTVKVARYFLPVFSPCFTIISYLSAFSTFGISKDKTCDPWFAISHSVLSSTSF